MPGQLTTHVLDTVHGCPAAGVAIEVWRLTPTTGVRTLLTSARTNAGGRTSEPLLAAGALSAGIYELIFMVGDYFASRESSAPAALPFLDHIPVRFAIADPDAHYHVPLLVSPWSYTTYRGS